MQIQWKTILVGLAMAIVPNALDYMAGIKWEDYVGPTWAPVIAGGIMIGMRFVTRKPVITK